MVALTAVKSHERSSVISVLWWERWWAVVMALPTVHLVRETTWTRDYNNIIMIMLSAWRVNLFSNTSTNLVKAFDPFTLYGTSNSVILVVWYFLFCCNAQWSSSAIWSLLLFMLDQWESSRVLLGTECHIFFSVWSVQWLSNKLNLNSTHQFTLTRIEHVITDSN